MALYKFAKAIKESKFIKLFNGGNHIDLHIDDVVSAIILLIKTLLRKEYHTKFIILEAQDRDLEIIYLN